MKSIEQMSSAEINGLPEEEYDLACDAMADVSEEDMFEMRFADPGGNSSLYPETKSDRRRHPCPTCGSEYELTQKDVDAGYQCNSCADADEGFSHRG